MKKLFSILMSFVMALSNNVGYQEVPDKPFATSGGEAQTYYVVEEVEEPDYRQMYNDDVPVASETVSCKTKKFASNAKPLNYDVDGVPYKAEGDTGTWLVDNETKNYSELPTDKSMVTIDAPSDGTRTYICAPYACLIQVSSKVNDGKSITVSCTRNADIYTLQISDIVGWWCCAGKANLPEPHNCMQDLKGTVVQRGQVLAVTEGPFSVTVTKDGESISLQEFYAGTKSE